VLAGCLGLCEAGGRRRRHSWCPLRCRGLRAAPGSQRPVVETPNGINRRELQRMGPGVPRARRVRLRSRDGPHLGHDHRSTQDRHTGGDNPDGAGRQDRKRRRRGRRRRHDRGGDLARLRDRRLRDLGRLDHRGARAVGCRRRARAAHGRRLHARHDEGEGARGRGAHELERRAPGAEPHHRRRRPACAGVRCRPADPCRHDLQAGRVTVLAAIRPTSWELPLFLHVLGAMVLVGGLLTGASFLAFARSDPRYLRLGYWSLLALSAPGWVLMRAGAEWIASREGWNASGVSDPTWLSIGRIVADLGGLLLLVALIVGGFGLRRLQEGKGSGVLKATLWVSIVLLAAYVVAAWAMAGKPT